MILVPVIRIITGQRLTRKLNFAVLEIESKAVRKDTTYVSTEDLIAGDSQVRKPAKSKFVNILGKFRKN